MKIKKIKELIYKLNDASQKYYNDNIQILSDYEYDKLYDELQSLEKETNIIMSNSPTQKVGYEVLSNLQKVNYKKPMLSLDKTKEITKLENFLGDNIGILSLKLDGLTIILEYDEGILVRGVTRGNGIVGEDVTHNVKMFQNIPLKINNKEQLIIRGEASITFTNFEKINNELTLENKYKNPRNLCSGSVRQLNNEITAKRYINFVAFEVISENLDLNKLKSYNLKFIQDLGFTIVPHKMVDKNNLEETVENFKKELENNDFATDGLVLTYDDIEFSKSLGVTSKFPKDSLAFKWKDEIAETVLLEIKWNTSRTGLINPVGIFEPVDLEGTTVSKASLHNLSMIETLELGVGDKINVYKANMSAIRF